MKAAKSASSPWLELKSNSFVSTWTSAWSGYGSHVSFVDGDRDGDLDLGLCRGRQRRDREAQEGGMRRCGNDRTQQKAHDGDERLESMDVEHGLLQGGMAVNTQSRSAIRRRAFKGAGPSELIGVKGAAPRGGACRRRSLQRHIAPSSWRRQRALRPTWCQLTALPARQEPG